MEIFLANCPKSVKTIVLLRWKSYPSVLHLLYIQWFAPHQSYDDLYSVRWANRHAGL